MNQEQSADIIKTNSKALLNLKLDEFSKYEIFDGT